LIVLTNNKEERQKNIGDEIMETAPEIIFKGITKTSYIDKLITRGIAKLEQVCNYIISTRVTVEQIQTRHQTDNPYRILVEISIRDRPDVVVERLSNKIRKAVDDPDLVNSRPVRKRNAREEALPTFIISTFDSARRELEKIIEKQRGAVKVHPQQRAQAMVEKIFRDQESGFLRASDGQSVYFNRNSVLHDHWEHLKVGTAVRYTQEIGDKGLQASIVEPVEIRGTAEIHGSLHDSAIES
jgi:cold shock CspA family protein